MVSALSAFNAFVPKDFGARRAAWAVPFGDHARQAMDVYVPRRRPAGGLPILVFFYGGNWAAGMRQGYGFAGRAVASLGFVTVVPD